MKKTFKNIINVPKKVLAFLISVKSEVQKTEFASKSESFRLATVVLTGSIAMSLILFGIDTLFIFVRTYLTNLNQ